MADGGEHREVLEEAYRMFAYDQLLANTAKA